MSPVSRRRPDRGHRRTGPGGGTGADAARLRAMPAYDVLAREVRRHRDAADAFRVEGALGYLLGLLDERGPEAGASFGRLCREALADGRTPTSLLGLQVASVLAAMGHPSVRDEAVEVVAGADPALVAEMPPWCRHLGRVHVVEAGSIRRPDGSETVLHVMLDYDDPTAGSRHLLSVAVAHREDRVHLLDVRGRGSQDSLAPVAETYAGSSDPVWSWHGAEELEPLVASAVRTTWTHREWTVQDLEGGPTPAWALGTRRLERVTGADLRP